MDVGKTCGEFVASVKKVVPIGKALLVQITVEVTVLIILEFIIISTVKPAAAAPTSGTTNQNPTVVYGVLLIMSFVFFMYLGWDAIVAENTVQLFALMFFSLLLMVYSLIRLGKDSKQILYIVNFVIILVGELLLFAIGYKVYAEFGWRVYKKVGADPRMRGMYRTYLILITLIKLDFIIAITLIAQNLALALSPSDYEFYLNIIAVPFVIFYMVLLMIAVRKESVVLVGVFVVLSVLEPLYIVFKIARFYTVTGKGYENLPLGQIVASAATGLVVRVLVLIVTYKAYKNFGKDLRQHLDKDAEKDDGNGSTGTNLDSLASFNKRKMTME